MNDTMAMNSAAIMIAALLDCGISADCNYAIHRALQDPAYLHEALKEARASMDKTNVMIPTSHDDDVNSSNGKSKKKQGKPPPSLRGQQRAQHFCQKEDHNNNNNNNDIDDHSFDDDYMQRYQCDQKDPNKIHVCHYNGVQFNTMCVRSRSPLFRNLHHLDYCGPCRHVDVVQEETDTAQRNMMGNRQDGLDKNQKEKVFYNKHKTNDPRLIATMMMVDDTVLEEIHDVPESIN
jgi:hypothetical protein